MEVFTFKLNCAFFLNIKMLRFVKTESVYVILWHSKAKQGNQDAAKDDVKR